jgi:hypothetical protein
LDYHLSKLWGNHQSALALRAQAPGAAATGDFKIGPECALYVMAKLRKWLPKSASAPFLPGRKP